MDGKTLDTLNLPSQPESPIELFELQVTFAQKASELARTPFEQALMEYTNFYSRIGIKDWKFDALHPLWSNFMEEVKQGKNPASLAYELCLISDAEKKASKTYFGCFRFDYKVEDEEIRIHFYNKDKSGNGPLSSQQIEIRKNELKEMFVHIKANHPKAKRVIGGSWLYNYQNYLDLFPPSFTQDLKIEKEPFPRSMGIWGQFIASDGSLNATRVDEFLTKVQAAKNKDELLQAFPFRIKYSKGRIEDFYAFYSVG